jgi:NADPH:quinone reductase-like Zn-dependent oxidoreductase
MVMVKPKRSDLEWLATAIADGGLKVHIEKEYPLKRLAEAFAESQKGHTRGKILISVS